MLKHEQPLVQDYMAETFNSVSGVIFERKTQRTVPAYT